MACGVNFLISAVKTGYIVFFESDISYCLFFFSDNCHTDFSVSQAIFLKNVMGKSEEQEKESSEILKMSRVLLKVSQATKKF